MNSGGRMEGHATHSMTCQISSILFSVVLGLADDAYVASAFAFASASVSASASENSGEVWQIKRWIMEERI